MRDAEQLRIVREKAADLVTALMALSDQQTFALVSDAVGCVVQAISDRLGGIETNDLVSGVAHILIGLRPYLDADDKERMAVVLEQIGNGDFDDKPNRLTASIRGTSS